MSIINLTALFILSIYSVSSDSNVMVIDPFEYAQNSDAQEIWKPQAGSLPVEITSDSIRKNVMLMPCDFSRETDRCYWDRNVNLDLTKYGRFSIWIYAENPGAIRSGTIYFQSGNGWFSGHIDIGKKEWQKLSIRKSDFRSENSPTGWDSISTIRLSFWKANDADTVVAVDDFEAAADEIAIVFNDLAIRENPGQADTVQNSTDSMSRILDKTGLEFGVINDRDIESGVLSGCKLAIFPYNPNISQKEIESIRQFVNDGGKLMYFYMLPDEIAELLGLEKSGWMREEYSGQFDSISMDAKEVDGLPESIAQGSWNTTTVKPKTSETRVIGKWVDSQGKVSERPAITINKNGMFMGHVLLSGDPENKKQMLLALFGEMLPEMRQKLSKIIIQNTGKMGGLENLEAVNNLIKSNLQSATKDREKQVLNHLDKSSKLLTMAEKASKKNKFGKVLKISNDAATELQEAFLLSFPSREGEFRALWCHSAFGIPGYNWDKAIEHIKNNGFNVIVPNMLWGGLAYYPSDVLPVAKEVADKGDQILQCLEACRKYGVQIHVWKVNWNLSNAPSEFIEQLRKDLRLQVDKQGNEVKWLCPSNPDNYKLELDSMLEIVKNYGVDGIHFDYIRYPNGDSCYCQGCRERYENSRSIKVEKWPEDVISGAYTEDFSNWRKDQITNLVKAVSKQAREINPQIKISAAVFSDYPSCIKSVGQDWKLWIESGYLDFVCPMDYTGSNERFQNLVTNQVDIVGKRIPLYPGIGASAPGLTPDQVAIQAKITRDLGADGFIIFNYDLSTAKSVLPALFKGVTSE
jgi:uncharacterized lipoprotein YddW (UPF0748 family)